MKLFYNILWTGMGIVLFATCTSDGSQATYSTNEKTLVKGEQLFGLYCSACHNFRAKSIGPSLAGVTLEVSEEWLKSFIRNPQQVMNSGDERAIKLQDSYQQFMPSFKMLSDEELEAILAYMHTYQEKKQLTSNSYFGEPITNPIPKKIPQSDITLTLREIAQAPPTATEPPVARINKMAALPDGSKRLFIHDLRGKLYELKDGKLNVFLEMSDHKPHFIHQPGLGTGFGSFAFHPDYKTNGIFYTTHTENPETSAPADFSYADTLSVTVRWVVTEWQLDNPKADVFFGTNRELLRIDMVTGIHGVQEITFNPTAKTGDADYGKLYIGIGDGGSVGDGRPFVVQNKSQLWGSIIRIDPTGNNSKNGSYGIPADNPYAKDGDSTTLGEIWARGFRNPHRMTWDAHGDGKMLASDIGQHSLEELNIIISGANYGWAEREGTFALDKQGDLAKMYPLPEDDAKYGYTYPVVQFDHDEANAISSGYIYHGEAAPALQGKYIFGGIVNGRIFCVDANSLQLGQQAPIQEVGLQLENGKPTTLEELTENSRVDLRFGLDAEEELYLFTKADGKIYKVVGDRIVH